MRLITVDSVVIGRFNPGIIAPDWLVRHGVLSQEEQQVEINAEVAAPLQRIVFKMAGFSWKIDTSKLVVETTPEKDPSEKALAIVDLLKHTPILAVGHNFQFETPVEDWDTDRIPTLGNFDPKTSAAIGEVRQTGYVFEASDEHVRRRVQVGYDGKTITIHQNYHRTCTQLDQIRQAIRSYAGDLEAARALAVSLRGDPK